MADINPQAWLDGFKRDHPTVQQKMDRAAEEARNSKQLLEAALVSGGRLTLTPRGAHQILDTMIYDKQRRTEKAHIATLAEEIRRDKFFGGTQIAFGQLPDSSLHLVNGQHRLRAVIEAQRQLEFQILIVPCADRQELDTLYYRFDTVMRRRTGATVRGAIGFAKEWGITNGVAGGLWEAGPIIAHGLKSVPGGVFEPHLKTPDGRYEAIIPFQRQAVQFSEAVSLASAARKKRLTNGGVVAVALLTLRDQPDKALPFWCGVAENSGLQKGDPRHALVEYLGGTPLLIPNAAINVCRNAWNNWFRNKAVKYLKATETDDVKLLGVRL